ncbi:ABC transporter substrate-binding protein [Desulfovibrio aminophilus]|uniref:ABC transporter substrate-binding protein n=1 Tax=Desulfovibrio aminophilus TaxID=81425 RepID=UPI003396B87F
MRRLAPFLICLALFAGIWTCSRPRPLRIAISAWPGMEVAELAARLGLYAKHGVDVRMVRFSTYGDSLAALRDGKVEAGMQTLDDSIRQAAGRDIRVVLVTDSSFGGDGLVARKEINELAGLKGRRVGVEVGTVSHYSLLQILKRAGLTQEDVTVVSIPAWEIKAAFLAGTIDAGVTWEPYLSAVAEEGEGRVLIDSRSYPDTILTTMTFAAEVVRDRPEDVRRVLAAYFEAFDFLRSLPREANELMARAEDIEVDEFIKHADGLRYMDLEANRSLFADGRLAALTRDIGLFLRDAGLIRVIPNPAELLKGDLLPDAAPAVR